MAQVATSALPQGGEESPESRMAVRFLMSALESMKDWCGLIVPSQMGKSHRLFTSEELATENLMDRIETLSDAGSLMLRSRTRLEPEDGPLRSKGTQHSTELADQSRADHSDIDGVKAAAVRPSGPSFAEQCKELTKYKAEVACIAMYETDVFVVGTDKGRAFVNARADFQKDFAKYCVAEGLQERKPLCPENGLQADAGETEMLRRAVEDYFCLCYGKALGTAAVVPVPYEKMLRDQSAVVVQGLPEGVAFKHPEHYDLATLKWILENKARISFIISRPFLEPAEQPGPHVEVTDGDRAVTSPGTSPGSLRVKTEPTEECGIPLKAMAPSVKKESEEDANYSPYLLQEAREDAEAEVKVEGKTDSLGVVNSAAGVEDLHIVQVAIPDTEKEKSSHAEKIKQLREQVNELFSRKFGEAIGVDFPVKVPYRKITFNPGCVLVQGMPPGVVFKAPGYLEISSMKRILDAAEFIKFTVVRPLPGVELSNVGKRKIDQEGRMFQEKWERAYFFVEVQNIPTCLICKQSMSVSKEYNLRRHYQTNHSKHFDQYTEEMRDEKLQELKEGFGGALSWTAETERPQPGPGFPAAHPPAHAAVQPVEDMGWTLWGKLREKIESFVAYSVAIDEIRDTNNTPQLAIFIRGVDENFEVSEELLDTVPTTGTRSGSETFLRVEKSLKKFSIDWSKLVSVASTGTPAMVNGTDGLVTKLKAKVAATCQGSAPKSVCCIIHQESLCAQKLKMDHVMDVVVSSVNWICSRGLNHREFTTLLYELDSQYGSLLYYSEIKWLGRGLVLKRFFESLEEIDSFMASRGNLVPQLRSTDWIKDLAFLVDMTMHLNTLTISLQGHSQIVTQMYDVIRAFLAKLGLWETHLARNNLAHFPTLRSVSSQGSDGLHYIPKIAELRSEFQARLADFKLCESELALFSSPFSVKVDSVPEELQMELIDLQCNTALKAKYDKVGIPEFYKYLWSSYPKYRHHCAKILSMFGSTYICEQLFSIMKLSKTKLRESPWDSVLHIAT
ncbi:general transcription factor II-I repeat domain-containing protein 2 isoform X1 [Echinops telfairi]|uniref:General transcription factor II-I repeat domain-containing protein 2 isoform X1 n=1 Tax=Echinops telfairi TaxID=9371 RepID=A0AC55CI10_ECHTE|nr:general transcription factor II-I repeat domain-containing protein 2 isoform X1 [Echinops telfairi]